MKCFSHKTLEEVGVKFRRPFAVTKSVHSLLLAGSDLTMNKKLLTGVPDRPEEHPSALQIVMFESRNFRKSTRSMRKREKESVLVAAFVLILQRY